MSDSLTALRTADPARGMDFQVLEATPVFDELLDAIVSGQFVADDALSTNSKSHHGGERPKTAHHKRAHLTALISVAGVLVLLAAGLTIGLGTGPHASHSSLPNGARVTPWHAARPLPVNFHVPSSGKTSQSWQL